MPRGRRRLPLIVVIVIIIGMALAFVTFTRRGLLLALPLLGRTALEFAGAALLRAATLPLRGTLGAAGAGAGLPLRMLPLRGGVGPHPGPTLTAPHRRAHRGTALRATAQFGL